MAWVYAVICLAVIECFVFGMLAGRARHKYKVPVPAMVGDPIFERHQRVHYNTIELLVCFVPALLVFAHTISEQIATGLGLLFVIGRVLYLRGYVADPAKRSAGFGLSALPVMIAMVGGLIGAVRMGLAA